MSLEEAAQLGTEAVVPKARHRQPIHQQAVADEAPSVQLGDIEQLAELLAKGQASPESEPEELQDTGAGMPTQSPAGK